MTCTVSSEGGSEAKPSADVQSIRAWSRLLSPALANEARLLPGWARGGRRRDMLQKPAADAPPPTPP